MASGVSCRDRRLLAQAGQGLAMNLTVAATESHLPLFLVVRVPGAWCWGLTRLVSGFLFLLQPWTGQQAAVSPILPTPLWEVAPMCPESHQTWPRVCGLVRCLLVSPAQEGLWKREPSPPPHSLAQGSDASPAADSPTGGAWNVCPSSLDSFYR